MFLFRVHERWLAAAACFAFVLLAAITVYLMQSSWLLVNLWSKNNFYVMIALMAIAIVFFILWFFGCFPKFVRVYVILLASLAFVPFLGAIITMKMTLELRHPVLHIREEGEYMLRTSACFAEETRMAIYASRQSLFKNEHVQTIQKSIGFVKETFDLFSDTTETFTEGVVMLFDWLDSKGISCKTLTSLPFKSCVNHCDTTKENCQNLHFGILCEVVNICHLVCKGLTNLANFACSTLVDAAVSHFGAFKKFVANLVIKHTSMRVGFRLAVNTTDHIQDHYVMQFKNLSDTVDSRIKSLGEIVRHIDVAVKIGAPILFCLFPVGYLIMFMYGPDSFDNKFIDPDLETDYTLIPLKKHELKKIRYMSEWTPSWRRVSKTLRRSLPPGILIFGVLAFTFLLQQTVSGLHRVLSEFLAKFDGKIFDIQRSSEQQGGIAQIVDILLQILDQMQTAADLGRVRHCVTEYPPKILYQYWPFAVSFCLLVLFIASAENLTQFPVIMCSRFYRPRYVERHLHLRYHILMKRVYGEIEEEEEEQQQQQQFKK